MFEGDRLKFLGVFGLCGFGTLGGVTGTGCASLLLADGDLGVCVDGEEGVVTRWGAGDAGACDITLGSECLVEVFFVCSDLLNMFDSSFNAAICSSPTVAKGAAGYGLRSACVSSCAAIVAASADDRIGMVPRWGKNSRVRTILVARVERRNT